MKRDVNIGLLILIIASIIVFSGFTVYYQSTFQDVSLEYQSKLEQLGKVTQELSSKRLELNETYSLKKKIEEDRNTLDVRYKDVSDENTFLSTELTTTKVSLAQKSAELTATANLLSQTQSSLSAANSEVSSLKSRVNNLKDDVDRLCGKMAEGESDGDC
jgi:chromosome segregation ATPase|tara:strand:+ start:571 stop:1050 length:480 start_codon:yes stop_codon:yes gene_type:complete